MNDTLSLSGTFTVLTPVQHESFPNLPALAERLGVGPNEGDMSVSLSMNDGRNYSLFGLINALLDKVEHSVREPS